MRRRKIRHFQEFCKSNFPFTKMWIQLPKIFTCGLGPFAGFLRLFRKSAATRVEAFEEDEKEEEGDEPAEEARERRRVRERAAQERRARVGEHGGQRSERGERQREQCGAEAATKRGLPEGDERPLRFAEQDRVEKRPLQRAEEVGEQLKGRDGGLEGG